MSRLIRLLVYVAAAFFLPALSWGGEESLLSYSEITVGQGDGSITAYAYAEILDAPNPADVYIQMESVLSGGGMGDSSDNWGYGYVSTSMSGTVEELGATYTMSSSAYGIDYDGSDETAASSDDSYSVPGPPSITLSAITSDGSDATFNWNVDPPGLLYTNEADCTDMYHFLEGTSWTVSLNSIPSGGGYSCNFVGAMYGFTTEGAGGSVSSTEVASSGSGQGSVSWFVAPEGPLVTANLNLSGLVYYQNFSFSTGGGMIWMMEGSGNLNSTIASGPSGAGTLISASGSATVSNGGSASWSAPADDNGQLIYSFDFHGYQCPSCTGWGVTVASATMNCLVTLVDPDTGLPAYDYNQYGNPVSFTVSW